MRAGFGVWGATTNCPRAFDVEVAVVIKVWTNVGDPLSALVDLYIPPSPAALTPFIQTTTVLPVGSLGSNSMSLMLRFPVHGLSKHVPAAGADVTVMRVTVAAAGTPPIL